MTNTPPPDRPGPMRPGWPAPPGPDATWDEIRRYANLQATADYFMTFDENAVKQGLMRPEWRMTPQQAWKAAEEFWADGRGDAAVNAALEALDG